MLRKNKASSGEGNEGKRGSLLTTFTNTKMKTASTTTTSTPVGSTGSVNHRDSSFLQHRNPSTMPKTKQKRFPSAVVASLQQYQQQQQPSPSSTTPPPPTTTTIMMQNPSYTGIALSPCRTYGVLACKDTIQIVHISAMNGIELVKSIVVTPYFQRQQQQQQQGKGRNSIGSSKLGGSFATSSYMYPSSSSSSSKPSSSTTGGGNTFLNIRDFALSGGGGGGTTGSSGSNNNNSASINSKNKNTTATMQSPLIDTQLIVITAVAWSNGLETSKSTPKTSTITTTTNDIPVMDSNGNNTDSDSVPSKATSTSLLHQFDDTNDIQQQERHEQQQQRLLRASMIAVAGSNGVIAIWNVASLLALDSSATTADERCHDYLQPQQHPKSKSINSSSTSQPLRTALTAAAVARTATKSSTPSIITQQPSVILSHNYDARQVNALAFHPMNHKLLLSASQDCTIIVWEQRECASSTSSIISNNSNNYKSNQQQQYGLKGLFGGFGGTQSQPPTSSSLLSQQTQNNNNNVNDYKQNSYTWHCRTTFTPKCEAIRDVQWSPIFTDVFALVTSSGSLLVYNQYITARVIIRISAHSSDASTIQWHPTRCNVIATGGDRSVKIWDFQREFEREFSSSSSRDDIMTQNMERNASTSTSRGGESVGTNESSTVTGIDTFSPYGTIGTSSMTYGAKTFSTNSAGNINTSQMRKRNVTPLHVLSISAGVTKIRWRPVANVKWLHGDDLHDSMIAVSTAPIKGANAGGAGTLSLWSFHRPFMPLSIVEGHQDGAVVDFDWLETPQPSHIRQAVELSSNEENLFPDEYISRARIWQHVISVGRDGNCFLQSLVRGDRPISRVPPSCFAMANLSPFQKGYGSLQMFTVCQPVPTGLYSDVMLTGLRIDRITTNAPGIFRESQLDPETGNLPLTVDPKNGPWKLCTRIPQECPPIQFNVIDQGELDQDSNPIYDNSVDDSARIRPIVVAPEVVHLSRFAQRYKLYVDSDYPSILSLCIHNANVAESLSQEEVANMWRIIALMLESCILGDNSLGNIDDMKSLLDSNEKVHFVFLPSLKRVLEERADAGDVQTCVALCEVFAMIQNDQGVLIKDLDIENIREWYLSYIDLLRDMCLFSYATYIIKHCRDPIINALNQQSTTIHESCPHCGKVMLPDDNLSANGKNGASKLLSMSFSNARRICKSCRRRVGLCFLCHEPVKGVYVWCPGCGHGGHLDHALQWFGGGGSGASNSTGTNDSLRTMCPTGCGHQCNLMRQVSAFPRTESFS